MYRRVVFVSVIAFAVLFFGCATVPMAVNMTPDSFDVSNIYPYKISLNVTGGQETTVFSSAKISDMEFQKALEEAIKSSRIFSEVVTIGSEQYRLEVVITNQGTPEAGLDMTVTLTTNWKLTEKGSDEAIWQDFIATKYTARLGQNLYGAERLQMALEGAGKENIREGIRRLSRIKLER